MWRIRDLQLDASRLQLAADNSCFLPMPSQPKLVPVLSLLRNIVFPLFTLEAKFATEAMFHFGMM